jgi:hypothetical protein
MSVTPFFRQTFRRLDVLRLRALVAAAQKDNHGITLALEIDPVAGAMVDAQFADPVADRLHVARMSIGKAVETREDHASRPFILEPRPPFPERLGLFQLNHEAM